MLMNAESFDVITYDKFKLVYDVTLEFTSV